MGGGETPPPIFRNFFKLFVDFSGKVRIILSCMDTKKECSAAPAGGGAYPLGGKLVVGAKQLRKALIRGAVQEVFLAKDADPAVVLPLENLCREKQIVCTWVPTMDRLGKACGIDVGAAAAAVVA